MFHNLNSPVDLAKLNPVVQQILPEN
jgi:hypothetical protein